MRTTSTIGRTYSITDSRSATIAAAECQQSAYAAEIAAYEDSKRFREINIEMRTNRAVGF